MAIDKAIEYKMQGGVKNYKPSKMVKAPVTAKSSPDTPTAHLAYITDKEKDNSKSSGAVKNLEPAVIDPCTFLLK